MEQCFIINGRFLVDPTANLLTDHKDGSANRLEDRLVQVLCILTAAAGRTVLREEFIEKVWHNYGGGDEGLTQAISTLRKALNDKDKIIIQTVPKKGYIYTGTTTAAVQAISGIKPGKKAVVIAMGIVAIVLLFFLIFFRTANISKQTTSKSQKITSNRLNDVADENIEISGLNSVTYRDNDRNSYKWISNGDAQPEFYINNVRLPIGKWEPHMTMIAFLKHKLQEKINKK